MESEIVLLVVDDDPSMRNYARTVLINGGYRVLTATDGEDALSVSRRFQGEIETLLSDMDMPRMGGPELRQRILLDRPEMRVILMSASSLPPAGVEFIEKPLEAATLLNRIRGVRL